MNKTATFTAAAFSLAFTLVVTGCGNGAPAETNQENVKKSEVVKGGEQDHSGHDHAKMGAKKDEIKNGFDSMPPVGTKALCPVMGNEFEVKADSEVSVHGGKTYVFCCPGCKPKFDENPEKYL